MSTLLSRHQEPDNTGLVQSITPERAQWKHVGFDVYHLHQGQSLQQVTGDQEVCLVLVTGRADINTKKEDWKDLGDRISVFEDKAPHAVYVPHSNEFTITATTNLEIAVCRAPGFGDHAARLIAPESMGRETRGQGTNTRHVCNILPQTEPADSLLVVEVITPNGSWSSYPPHKHDTDNMPSESQLEEIYYHRLQPSQGFAFQRVYTDDRSLDETMVVHDGDVVMVPRGYHPAGAPHGYDLYYLNVMAGPSRVWKFKNDPAHEWIVQL